MKKTITHHPLRTIELAYHRDRPQPDWEKETLAQYIHLHDEVLRFKTMCEEYKARLDQLAIRMNEARDAIEALRPQLTLLEAATGIRAAEHVYGEDESHSFRIDMNDFLLKRDNLSEMMAEIRPAMARCTKEYHQYRQDYKVFDEWFEQFDSERMLDIYRRYDEVSVDTVSLDIDHQRLLGAWHPIIFAEREYYEVIEQVFMNYDYVEEAFDFLVEDIEIVKEALHNLHDTRKSNIITIKRTDDGEYHAF